MHSHYVFKHFLPVRVISFETLSIASTASAPSSQASMKNFSGVVCLGENKENVFFIQGYIITAWKCLVRFTKHPNVLQIGMLMFSSKIVAFIYVKCRGNLALISNFTCFTIICPHSWTFPHFLLLFLI